MTHEQTHFDLPAGRRGSPRYPGTRRGLRPLRRSARCARSDVSFHHRYAFRGVHERQDPTPSQELNSREELAPVFADLNKYDATTHFVGQSTVFTLTNERATGEAYCLAHHVTVDGEKRRLMVASLRYQDTFVKMDGAWLFAERLLYVDWLEERALS
jgi:SnoaL-like domain